MVTDTITVARDTVQCEHPDAGDLSALHARDQLPATAARVLYFDFQFNAQAEDVVAVSG
jgi:hypothetical protein